MEENIPQSSNSKPKKCKYIQVGILFLLIESIFLLGYLVFFKREVLEDLLMQDKIEEVKESKDEDNQVVDETEEPEEEDDEYEDWITYTNEEMGFKISYPETVVVNGNTIYLALMEREHYRSEKVNCVKIGPR